jgi:hypothetical protein
MPAPDPIRSLVSRAARDAADAADNLYALQQALRGAAGRAPVEASEAATLQRRAEDLAAALRDIEGRRGW